MLSDNIKILRKKKGYSQETLAEQLHVVRQTISKWEKGISVPDAVMLDRMAELFEVPVSVLLGGGLEVEEEQPSELNEIAQQLAVLNDQLVQQAVRRRKVIRYAFVGVFAAIFVLIGADFGCTRNHSCGMKRRFARFVMNARSTGNHMYMRLPITASIRSCTRAAMPGFRTMCGRSSTRM